MQQPSLIALMTDFGTDDIYVASMKGVMLSIAPEAKFLDLTHGIRSHDIREGAYLLSSAEAYLPANTIVLAVVDPGVGSDRRGLIARAGTSILVGPDNGLFTFFWLRYPDALVHELASHQYRLANVSSTFHGRDIFAPAAAWAARGVALERFGPRVERPMLAESLAPVRREATVEGVVIHVDRFGNLVTNLSSEWLDREGLVLAAGWCIELGGRVVHRTVSTYAEARWDEPVALWGSTGFLEISYREKPASQVLGAEAGTPVRLIRRV